MGICDDYQPCRYAAPPVRERKPRMADVMASAYLPPAPGKLVAWLREEGASLDNYLAGMSPHCMECGTEPAKLIEAADTIERLEANLAGERRLRAAYYERCETAEHKLHALDGAAWLDFGAGHWTREPAEVEGDYLEAWCYEGVTDVRSVNWYEVGDTPRLDLRHDHRVALPLHRWSVPLPEMPPVPEGEGDWP